jgi:hypothetical protein
LSIRAVDMSGLAAMAFCIAASRSAALTNVAAVPRGAGAGGAGVGPPPRCWPLTTIAVNTAVSPTAAIDALIMRGL